MRPPFHRLGFRLTLLLVAFVLLLAVSTMALVIINFRETQRNATERSVQSLEAQARTALAEIVQREARLSEQGLQAAAAAGRTAASYLGAVLELVGEPDWELAELGQGPGGERFNPDPERRSDLWLPQGAGNEALAALRDAAVLEPLLPNLLVSDAVSVYFVSPEGAVRYYPPVGLHEILPPDLDITAQPTYYLGAPEHNPEGATAWTPPYLDDAGQGLLVTATTPVYVAGEFRGVVGVDVSLARLAARLETLEPTPGSQAFIVSGEGQLVAASGGATRRLLGSELAPFGAMLSELDQPILAQALEEMRAGRSGARQLELEGEEVVLTYAPLADFGWSLGLLSPLDELTAPAEATASAIRRDATETVRSTLTIMAAFFLLALISATSFNRRFLTRPVEALAAGTREVAGGNLKVRIPVESGDELGLLAGSFNHMTEELERSIDERQLAEALVREKEAQYRGIFEATSDGVVIRKLEDFTIVEANPAYCAMHGLEREEIIGTAIGGEGYRDHLKLIEAEGQFRLQGIDHRADGTPFHVEVLGTKIGYLGKPHLLVTVRDVSERVQAFEFLERRVAERTRELSTLLDISHSVTFTLELSRLLELILDKLRDVVDYAAAAIFILKDGELELLSYRGPLEGERPRPLEDTRHGREVIERRAPLVIADVHAETELARSLRLAALDGRGEVPGYIASWMGVPLIVRDRVIGILAFEHGERGYYDAHRAALALAFANQAAVAIENAQLYEEASGKAALEERQRLARELHDSVSQALYGIALGARTARTQLERDPKRAAEPLDYVLKLAEAAVAEMRALIFELRPESLAKEGLVTALDKQASALRARYGLKVETTLPEEPQLPFAAKEALYRVAQEALHNVVKHAGAKNADLALEVGGGRVSLTIADDGVGFDPSGDFPGHLGLKSMRERLESIGGCLYIESAPEEGTRLSASVPLG